MTMSKTILLFVIIFTWTSVMATRYVLWKNKETWKISKEVCDVPDISELNANIELISQIIHSNEYVWTSANVMVSDWTKFYGCFDILLDKTIFNKELFREYFQRDIAPISSVSLQNCALYCTGKGKQFIYLMDLCQCIKDVKEYHYGFTLQAYCLQACTISKKNDIFCLSGKGIPVFIFNEDLENQIIRSQDIHNLQEQCIITNERRMIAADCSSTNYYRCKNKPEIYQGNWSFGVDWCLDKNSFIIDTYESPKWNFWIDYFLVSNSQKGTKDEGNRKCVALSIMDTNLTITYQYRKCSDRLYVVCRKKDKTNTTFPSTNSYVTSSLSDDASVSFVPETNIFNITPVVTINIVLFALCFSVAALFIFSKFKPIERLRHLVSPEYGNRVVFRVEFQDDNEAQDFDQNND